MNNMSFVQSGKDHPFHWVNYFWSVLAVGCGYFLGQLPMVIVQTIKIREHKIGTTDVKAFLKTNDFSLLHIDYNLGFLLMLLTFVGGWLGYLFLLKMQRIPLLSTLTSRKKFDFSRFFAGMGIWLFLTVIAELFFYFTNPGAYRFQFHLSAFIPLLIIGILLIPIQSAMEEVFFRGYILQGSFKATQSIIWSLVVSTCFFSLVHSANPEVAKFGFATMQVYYLGAGLFLALLAIADNGLELSIGIHTATNLFGSIVLKYEGSVLQTETLFEQKMVNPWPMTISFYLCAVVSWWVLSKKYGFSIQDILLGGSLKLNKNQENPIS
ncbi:MAG: CPBP family intramembrane metalloprotease [Saprospiraceae bacterium]|nr:CPBP family intramembrane metalloprotease [Saprospiraceae bacterium]